MRRITHTFRSGSLTPQDAEQLNLLVQEINSLRFSAAPPLIVQQDAGGVRYGLQGLGIAGGGFGGIGAIATTPPPNPKNGDIWIANCHLNYYCNGLQTVVSVLDTAAKEWLYHRHIGRPNFMQPAGQLVGDSLSHQSFLYNQMYMVPFVERVGAYTTSLGFQVNTAAAGAHAHIGIYQEPSDNADSAEGAFATLFVDAGTLSCANTGLQSVTFNPSIQFTPNTLYYFFIILDQSVDLASVPVQSCFPLWGYLGAGNGNFLSGPQARTVIPQLFTDPLPLTLNNLRNYTDIFDPPLLVCAQRVGPGL